MRPKIVYSASVFVTFNHRIYCAKGNQIGVNGHLVSRSYVNKQEQHVYVIELVVEELYFVEAKREQEAV